MTRVYIMNEQSSDFETDREIVDLSRRYRALLARIQEPNAGEEVWKELDGCEAKLVETRVGLEQKAKDDRVTLLEMGKFLGPETTGLKVTTAGWPGQLVRVAERQEVSGPAWPNRRSRSLSGLSRLRRTDKKLSASPHVFSTKPRGGDELSFDPNIGT